MLLNNFGVTVGLLRRGSGSDGEVLPPEIHGPRTGRPVETGVKSSKTRFCMNLERTLSHPLTVHGEIQLCVETVQNQRAMFQGPVSRTLHTHRSTPGSSPLFIFPPLSSGVPLEIVITEISQRSFLLT